MGLIPYGLNFIQFKQSEDGRVQKERENKAPKFFNNFFFTRKQNTLSYFLHFFSANPINLNATPLGFRVEIIGSMMKNIIHIWPTKIVRMFKMDEEGEGEREREENLKIKCERSLIERGK